MARLTALLTTKTYKNDEDVIIIELFCNVARHVYGMFTAYILQISRNNIDY